jgi:protein-tyrosine phosphatase
MELQKRNSNKPGHPIEPPKIEISTKKYNFYQNILENSKIPIQKNILEKQDNVELLTKLRKKEDEKLSALHFMKFRGFGIQEIIPGLFLSGQDVTKNKALLIDEKKITHILNLATNVENSFEKEIIYKVFKVEDSLNQDLLECIHESISFIDSALKDKENKVLVHCNAGVSRSASIVIAFLMFKRIYNNYEDAFKHVQSRRSVVYPNSNFVKQLNEFESMLNTLEKNFYNKK